MTNNLLKKTWFIPVNCFKLLCPCIIDSVVAVVRDDWMSKNIHSTCFWITPSGHQQHLKRLQKKIISYLGISGFTAKHCKMKHVTELFFFSLFVQNCQDTNHFWSGEITYNKQGAFPGAKYKCYTSPPKRVAGMWVWSTLKSCPPFRPVEIHGLLSCHMYILEQGSLIAKWKPIWIYSSLLKSF